jgi:hypothetical protein
MQRIVLTACLISLLSSAGALAGIQFTLTDPSGLAGEVEFTLLDPTTLEVRVRNISTGVPFGFDSADQLLTGVSWDFGAPGIDGSDPMITGGTVVTGASSASLNFSVLDVGPNADVSGEYGYGNMDGSGALINFVSGNTASATPFGGPNLDANPNIDGPQAGLVANPILVPLGGLGAIQDEIVATLTIDQELANLDFLLENLVRIEFGSDAAFLTTPEPASLMLVAAGCLSVRRRR